MGGRAVTDSAPALPALGTSDEPSTESACVLVEVGGDRGALVLYLDEGFRDHEVEISRVGQLHRVHTGVLEWRTALGPVLAAVFGSLLAGSYVVWWDATTPAATVAVTGGRVTEWTSH